MPFRQLAAIVAVALSAQAVCAVDHRVEKLDEAAPADEFAPEIAQLLAPTGVRLIRGTSRTVCDIWLCKEWSVKSFEPANDVIYPLVPGQLIGVAKFPRKSADFRDQEIPEGTYTLRYSQQPIDGAHVGTSPTRDFLLLLKAETDKSTETLEYKPLVDASKEAVETTHPALLSLQRIEGNAKESPSIRHDEDRDWWIVRLNGTASVGDKSQPLVLDLVVIGQATE